MLRLFMNTAVKSRMSFMQKTQPMYLRQSSLLVSNGNYRTFVKSMDDRKEEKDAQAFREDIEYFLSKEQFNIFDFHERVLHGLKSKSTLKVMIWGEDQEIKILEEQNKICSAMYDEEKTNYVDWSTDLKQEVAEAASV